MAEKIVPSEKREVGRPWAFPETKDWGVQFLKDWINGIIEGTSEIKDEGQKERVFWYAAAGCGSSYFPHLSAEHGYSGKQGDVEGLVAAIDAHMKERSGPGAKVGCVIKGKVVTVTMGSLKKEFYPRYPAVAAAVRKYGDVCVCPLVINGIIPLTPELCSCSQQLQNYKMETATGKRCTTEVLEAIARGGKNCVMRTTITNEPLDNRKKKFIKTKAVVKPAPKAVKARKTAKK